ncbi:MAG TPA: phosphoribosylaminoimidazolesuccinocarboxamide synthase [Thermoleophilia bacterium]|nr:phosphoribosylaminoimidazolesuccinocarboxamide synthase [Thermoleophilia bacterium]
MTRGERLYEGKAKIVYATDDPNVYVQDFKDSATAFDGKKKGTIGEKGRTNCAISSRLFELLEESGVPTHFLGREGDTGMRIRRLDMFQVEFVVRNVAAGSLSKRIGYPEGTVLKNPPIVEYYYKDDALGDPLLCMAHLDELQVISPDDLAAATVLAKRVNSILTTFFLERDLTLVDFKLEFGKDAAGAVRLGDEISPDTCRLWDATTNEKLDKDRFRRDLGGVEEAYAEVLRRISGVGGV